MKPIYSQAKVLWNNNGAALHPWRWCQALTSHQCKSKIYLIRETKGLCNCGLYFFFLITCLNYPVSVFQKKKSELGCAITERKNLREKLLPTDYFYFCFCVCKWALIAGLYRQDFSGRHCRKACRKSSLATKYGNLRNVANPK